MKLKTITQEEFETLVESHNNWLLSGEGDQLHLVRSDLSRSYLYGTVFTKELT